MSRCFTVGFVAEPSRAAEAVVYFAEISGFATLRPQTGLG